MMSVRRCRRGLHKISILSCGGATCSTINVKREVYLTMSEVQDQLDALADSKADSTDSDIRYLAYGARLRTALRASSRYVAYVRIYPTTL